MDDRHPASDALSTLTPEQLMVFEAVLAGKFDDTYRQALQEVGETGWVSAELSERLEQTQAMHHKVVQALELDRLEFQANMAQHPSRPREA